MGTDSYAFMNTSPISASDINATTLLMILDMEWIGPLVMGLGQVSLLKRCCPTCLKYLLTERYDTLMWTRKVMSLDLYRMVEYVCVAA